MRGSAIVFISTTSCVRNDDVTVVFIKLTIKQQKKTYIYTKKKPETVEIIYVYFFNFLVAHTLLDIESVGLGILHIEYTIWWVPYA